MWNSDNIIHVFKKPIEEYKLISRKRANIFYINFVAKYNPTNTIDVRHENCTECKCVTVSWEGLPGIKELSSRVSVKSLSAWNKDSWVRLHINFYSSSFSVTFNVLCISQNVQFNGKSITIYFKLR